MAVLCGPFYRALDDDGAIIPGAYLRIKVAGSATLATDVFDDPDLTPGTEIANPLQADTNGWFPLLYALAGSQYDVYLEDASNATVREFLSVEALGSDSASFERDFGTSRAAIRALASAWTSFEGGPPTGDDTGGKVRLGGWNGTQADEAKIDAVATDITGTVTVENGYKLLGKVLTDKTTFSAAATVAIPLSESPANVSGFEIIIGDLTATGTGAITGQFSFDGGSTYKSGASDYNYTKSRVDNAAGPGIAVSPAALGADTKLDLTYIYRSAANRGGLLRILVLTPDSGSGHTVVICDGVCLDSSSATYMAGLLSVGECVGGYGRATHLRISQSGQTLTGWYSVRALYGTGE